MNGAESLVTTLTDAGVDVCFANPGTSEMHFLAALENPNMKSVLCLFEGVCTGAADGYYRMKDAPASTLLHLGPGLANGLANIHNAKRASSGIVNIVGEHASQHLKYDAPLTSDIEGLARPLSHWVRRTDSPQAIASDAAAAVAKASGHPGQIATLILPGDASWGEAGDPVLVPTPKPEKRVPEAKRVDHVAQVLKSGEPALIVLAGKAMRGRALELAGRIAAKTGCRIATQFFSARIERGAGRVPLERIPYAVPQAIAFLAGFKHIITVETVEPIAFFSYPGKPSLLKSPDAQVHGLIEKDEDSIAGLEMLADALGARQTAPLLQAASDRVAPQGKLDPVSIAHALAAALPEHAILVDESLTTGRESMGLTAGALPHDTIQNMGGSIGYGTPVATGAAVACPDRRVVCMVGDGSAMYTIQSLWTQAREQLNVTTIIFANNSYQILKTEYANMDIGAPGPQALAMIDIDRPSIDWVAMARSMGVPAVSVGTAEDFYRSMVDLAKEPGPNLIEVRLWTIETSATPLVLRTNLADYPVTKAMKDKRATSDIVTLDYCGPETAHNGFKAMVRENKFDAGELAIVTYLQARACGKPYIALPAPINGRFQHHCAGFNKELGHLDPKDIEGKRVGVRTYSQTTGLWIRGILSHEYGVDLDKVTWCTVGEGHLAEYSDPPNSERLPKGSDIGQMMLDGELAATLQGIDLPKDPRVAYLVPNPKEAAQDWFAREGVVPINHLFVVHEDVSKNRPDVVREIYRMIKESRALTEGGVPVPYPPLGLEANRKGLQMAIEWAYEQKIIPHMMNVDELFDDTTANLD